MAYDETLANRVREYLAEVPDIEVTEKEMFAMLNFMVNGKTCVCINGEQLMLRFDPQLQEELAAKPGYETMLMKGKPYKGYCYMGKEGYTKHHDFVYLMRICLAYNKVVQSAKK